MPVISPQTKAIYDKAARSAANRRAQLLREKAASLALRKARSTVVTPTTTTSSPLRVSRGNQQLRQNKARCTSILRERAGRIAAFRPLLGLALQRPRQRLRGVPALPAKSLGHQIISEQEARTRDRITYYENFNQQQPRTAISVVTSFLCTYWGLPIIYLGLVLLSYYGVHLLRRYQ
jgi:hypothetical protein